MCEFVGTVNSKWVNGSAAMLTTKSLAGHTLGGDSDECIMHKRQSTQSTLQTVCEWF